MTNVIEVKNLTKCYKNLKAVDDLSFNVKKGESLFIPANSGDFTINGKADFLETRI